MKLIAHRGASLERQENSLESLVYAARLGADAVECDVRITADGQHVIFHDQGLSRLCGEDIALAALSLEALRERLARVGLSLLTLDTLLTDYHEKVPLLLHIKGKVPDRTLLEKLAFSSVPLIAGVESLDMLKAVHCFLPSEQILAFIPEMADAPAYVRGGAGIIRLWETWLASVSPAQIRALGHVSVWVMARDGQGSMNGSPEALDKAVRMEADGMLLNDIVMAIAWREARL